MEDDASHVVEARTHVASQGDGTMLLPIRKTQERHNGWMEGKKDACSRVEVARFREDGMGSSWPMRLWDDTPSTREPGFHSACACVVPAFPDAVHDVPRGPVSRTADRTCERKRRIDRHPRRPNADSTAVPLHSPQRVSSPTLLPSVGQDGASRGSIFSRREREVVSTTTIAPTTMEDGRTSRRVAVVTGASSGLGTATAKILARQNHTVVLACRSEEKAKKTAEEIKREEPAADVRVGPTLDLCRLESVQKFAKKFQEDYKKLHVLVNNAGAPNGSDAKRETVQDAKPSEGTSSLYQQAHPLARANVIGAHALTRLLMPSLMNSGDARVVNVSSVTHRLANFESADALFRRCDYGQTKLANVLFTFELQRRWGQEGKFNAVAVDPGGVRTGIWDKHKNFPWFAKRVVEWCYAPAEDAAKLVAFAATQKLPEGAMGNGNQDPTLRLLARGAFAWPPVTLSPWQGGQERGWTQRTYAAVVLLPLSLLDQPLRFFWPSFMSNAKAVCAAPAAYDRGLAEDLWEASENAVFGRSQRCTGQPTPTRKVP